VPARSARLPYLITSCRIRNGDKTRYKIRNKTRATSTFTLVVCSFAFIARQLEWCSSPSKLLAEHYYYAAVMKSPSLSYTPERRKDTREERSDIHSPKWLNKFMLFDVVILRDYDTTQVGLSIWKEGKSSRNFSTGSFVFMDVLIDSSRQGWQRRRDDCCFNYITSTLIRRTLQLS
jgi:hypothetical protein